MSLVKNNIVNSTKKSRKRVQIQIIDSDQEKIGSKPSKKVKTQTEILESFSEKANFYDTIEEVPVVKLTTKQMNSDPLQLLIELEEKYHQYGAVKIIVSDGWNSPFTFRYIDRGLTTRIQHINQLKRGKPFQQKIQKYTIKEFQCKARQYDQKYKLKTNAYGKTSQSKLQMEYWNLVSNPQYSNDPKCQITVQYAADLPSSKYGSGFPLKKVHNWLDADFQYENNLFNLNNLYKSPISLLNMSEARKQKVSGITMPWVYMGMKFSTFCWHVQDLWINSINYNHKGGIKTWYVVPPKYKEKFQEYIQKTYCLNNNQKKNLLNRITFMVDPQDLVKQGIKVYKVYQHPRQYVCTFFKAYHAGFSQSFNVGEAVNFFTPKSLQYIRQALQFQQKKQCGKPSVIPFDWLVVQNIDNAYKFGDKYAKIIKQNFDYIIEKQYKGLKEVLSKNKNEVEIKNINIIQPKTKYDKNMCSVCKNYEYLSSLKCQKCNKNYCYKHFDVCCDGHYTFLTRQIKQPRKRLIQIIPELKKYYKEQKLPKLQSKDTCCIDVQVSPKKTGLRKSSKVILEKNQ